jgi:hypothetical protein
MTEAIAKTNALAIPDYVEKTNAGHENITREDITFPQIKIAQSSSAEVKKSSEKHIEELEEGDLFNSLTKKIYKTPIQVIPILMFTSFIKFRPMDEGGGVIRMAATDENIDPKDLEFGPNGEKPVWTLLRNFLVYLPAYSEVAVMSMKSTQTKIAKKWLSLQSLFGTMPSYAKSYLFRTTVEKGKVASYFNYTEPVVGGFSTKEDYEFAKNLYAQFSGKTIKYDDREPGDDAPSF